MNSIRLAPVVGGIGIETENDPGDDLHAVAVDRRHRVEQRHDPVVRFAHGVERAQFGRLDAAEHRVETRLAHHREDVRALRDVERRLARELDRIAAPFLPLDQIGQQLARGLLVADEIVVDEIDRAGDPGIEHRVELGEDLLRRFEPGLAPVQRRDIAEFAAIRAAARKLHAAEKIAPPLDQPIGRDREIGERQALGGRKAALRRGRRARRRRARRSARRSRRRSRRYADNRTPDIPPGQADTDGPPSTLGLPASRARRAMPRISSFWTCMPLTKTASAQANSSAVAGRMFSSTSRTSQLSGR